VDHQVRRRALGARLEELGVDALLITDPHDVRYLTGFTGSNGQVVLDPGEARFLTDGRYTERSRNEVPDLERRTYPTDHRAEIAAFCAERGTGRLGFEADHVSVAGHGKLAEAVGGVELVPLDRPLEAQRRVKDDEERALIRRAQEATDAAFEAVLDLCGVGVSEQHIARELERLLREAGADGLAFEPIVAFGEGAAEPHHEPGHRLLEEGDVVKLDFGGLVEGYRTDMTRTIAFGGVAAELRKIHDVVREAQQAGIDAVHAGVRGSEVDAAARGVVESAGYGDRFVHGLGHGVGLQIHEPPWLGSTQEGELPAGAVVTIEPGIYVPGLGGVRIEDTVEVTDDGCRVLPTSTRELVEL
jgi:Xaa-Pro aminopeptidase